MDVPFLILDFIIYFKKQPFLNFIFYKNDCMRVCVWCLGCVCGVCIFVCVYLKIRYF